MPIGKQSYFYALSFSFRPFISFIDCVFVPPPRQITSQLSMDYYNRVRTPQSEEIKTLAKNARTNPYKTFMKNALRQSCN